MNIENIQNHINQWNEQTSYKHYTCHFEENDFLEETKKHYLSVSKTIDDYFYVALSPNASSLNSDKDFLKISFYRKPITEETKPPISCTFLLFTTEKSIEGEQKNKDVSEIEYTKKYPELCFLKNEDLIKLRIEVKLTGAKINGIGLKELIEKIQETILTATDLTESKVLTSDEAKRQIELIDNAPCKCCTIF